MANLINIIEREDGFTAEGISHVWEEYDAPRKRVKRVRPVEHRFEVKIPKVAEEDAPVAFVIEHFPEVSLNVREYYPGYDQQVRAYGGRFYTPARFVEHPSYCGSYADVPTELERAVRGVGSIPDYLLGELAEMASRDEIRADGWHSYGNVTASSVDEDAERATNGLVAIGGELYTECDEPVYVYHSPGWMGSRRVDGYISVSTNQGDSRYLRGVGALNRIEMAFYFDGVRRTAYIDVKRPDLVSNDTTEKDLEDSCERGKRDVESSARAVEACERKLEEARGQLEAARAKLEKSTARLEGYRSDPLGYWRDRLGEASESAFSSVCRRARVAERIIDEGAGA